LAKAIKTIKLKIVNPNKGKEDALKSTIEIFNSVLKTFLDLTLQHQEILTQEKEYVSKKTGEIYKRNLTSREILTEIEKISFKSKSHPNPQIDIKGLYPSFPTSLRRSCINTSAGMCKSYLSNLRKWQFSNKKSKSKNPPAPPTPRNLPTFYSGAYELELLDIQNQFVRLKVYSEGEWVFINYPVKMGKKHKEILTKGEWKILSPTLVPKKKKGRIEWYLHIPVEKVLNVKKIEEQKKENPNLTTLSVDMGLKHLAVITVRKGGKIVFVKFFRSEKIESHRLRHLQKIFKKQQKSGKGVKGQRSNKRLWEHIREMNDAYAHLVSTRIIEIAKKLGVDVIIIEHLRKFRNKRGENRSKRDRRFRFDRNNQSATALSTRKFNRKFTYWLKGKLEFNLRYKALEHGILVKSVNPAFTSQICNKCGGFGERFSSNPPCPPKSSGGALFRCFYCGYTANADFNASVNLHKVFWDIFPLPKRKKKYKKPARARKACRPSTVSHRAKGKVAHSGLN
jgi:IS605 OrfB family transposase